jgi:hypothetical protein
MTNQTPRKRGAGLGALLAALSLASACTSFAGVRSAEVDDGFHADLGITAATPPGDDAAWFWTLDCAEDCDHFIVSPHAAIGYGFVPSTGPSVDVGLGISGSYGYLEGYVQLARDQNPFGLGARIGAPGTDWREDSLFARFDRSIGAATRLLFVPSFFLHSGNSPNGQIPASFLAVAPGLGLFRSHEGGSYTVSLVPVFGQTKREYLHFGMTPRRSVTSWSGFLVAGLTLTIN